MAKRKGSERQCPGHSVSDLAPRVPITSVRIIATVRDAHNELPKIAFSPNLTDTLRCIPHLSKDPEGQ